MKNFAMEDIRNIAFVGATGAGKTTLVEQILNNTGKTTRIGSVDEGNTVMDYTEEEIEKKMSMNMGIVNFEWKKNKINLIDTPGTHDFANEQIAASIASETVLFFTNATSDMEVSFEQSYDLLKDRDVAKGIVINRMDNEGADYNKILNSLRENLDIRAIPITIPIGSESKLSGVIDLLKGKAFIKDKETEIPEDYVDMVEEKKLELTEAIAESDDELLEKYFEAGELTMDELKDGITKAIQKGSFIPVFATSAEKNVGVDQLLNCFINYLPSAKSIEEIEVVENEKTKKIKVDPQNELVAYIFKSITDPNLGDTTLVRVYSGELKSGMDVFVPEQNSNERIGSLYFIFGKKRTSTDKITAGDIGVLVKMKVTKTFNTMVSTKAEYRIPAVKLPSPVYWKSIKAKSQKDEDKIGGALAKLLEEDKTLKLSMNKETKENVISGLGELQINQIKNKLKTRYGINADFLKPKVPYKETVSSTTKVSYRHKKQSGGKGQYAEVYFKVSPKPRGEGFEFVNSIVGGAIPTKFIPAVEKGLKEILVKGIISGNPIVDIEVECYDGTFHEVDSSEMAFKIASWNALKKAFKEDSPILLEPIHKVKIIIPNEYMGDVMGDISTRRGRIGGMEQKGKKQILNAELPLAELFSYYPVLKSLTQGKGKFETEFSHYKKVPNNIAEEVIEAAQKDN